LIDNFNTLLKDREFIDCLVELDDYQYEIISQYVKIPKDIIKLIEKNQILRKHTKTLIEYKRYKSMAKRPNDEIL
jgi:hypothetical protein